MLIFAKVRSYIYSILHRSRREDEISEELQFHIESRAADLERDGMSQVEAHRRARVEFGAVQAHRASIRESLGLRWFDDLHGDLRYALRMLWRSKGFTAVAILSLALGIGANTIIFSLAKGVLMDQLAVPHAEQLRAFWALDSGHSAMHEGWGTNYSDGPGGPVQFDFFPYPVYQQLRQQNAAHPVMQDLFAYKDINPRQQFTATFDGHADLVTAQMVSGNYYTQLGVAPQLGRLIGPADDSAPGAGAVMVISDAFWSRAFGRSPSVIGKTIQVNFVAMTIIGVNPPGFTGAARTNLSPDIFFPLSMQPVLAPFDEPLLTSSNVWWVQIMGRALPGVSDAKAKAALNTWLAQDIRATGTMKKDETIPPLLLDDGSKGLGMGNRNYAKQLYVLMALAGFVLLLACANLANMLLARSATRQREMAVRLALGAGRGRILRQVLTESLLLSAIGGIVGLAIGYMGRNIIPHMYFANWEPNALHADFDSGILLYTIGVTLMTGILFGVAPAWQATRTEVNGGLKDSTASATRRRKGLAGRTLVVVQVALSMLLVIGAGLFASTLIHLHGEKLGFDASNIVMFDIDAPTERYPAGKDVELHQRIEERLAQIPGVQAVTLSEMPLVAHGSSNLGVQTDEEARHPGTKPHIINNNGVGNSFFSMYRIPILFGRAFDSTDTATSPHVAIINREMAKELYPNVDPIGRSFNTGFLGDHPKIVTYQIVGVAEDTKYSDLKDKMPAIFYRPYVQSKSEPGMTYEIKTPLAPAAILPAIRAAVGEIDHDLPLRAVRTQTEQINATISQETIFAMLTAAFGVLALVLACIGIYGIMAYNVAQRTNEIGIRMALGAQTSQMLGMVLREATWMALVGIAAGLGGSLLLTKHVKSLLYGLAPTDPWILSGAGVLLLVVALLAGWGPARKASLVQPMDALRHE